MTSDREIDICLVGVTGFTGRLASQYAREVNLARLAKNQSALKIGFCGRNEQQLNEIAKEYSLGHINPPPPSSEPEKESSSSLIEGSGDKQPSVQPPVELSAKVYVIGDMNAEEALDEMTKSCKAVCSYAGPFALCGEPLVASCAKNKTHYVDITAEVGWLKLMELKYDEQFRKNEVKCMPCCGYDFLPNDLLMMQLKLILSESKTVQSWGGAESMLELTHACSQSTPMVSAGTAYTATLMMQSFESVADLMRFYLNPYALCLKEKSKSVYNHSLTQMIMNPGNYVLPRPMETDCGGKSKKIEILPIAGPPPKNLDGFNSQKQECFWAREYCVPFCMSNLMNKYAHWSNEKQDHCFGKNLLYYGGEIRRNVLWAYLWSFMVWVGFAYCLFASLLPSNLARKILPAGGPPLDPKSDYIFAHLKARWRQGDVQLKWRMMGAESYVFAARGSFLLATCLVDGSSSLPKNYGLIPPSMGVGPRILNELVEYAGLEISCAQVQTYQEDKAE